MFIFREVLFFFSFFWTFFDTSLSPNCDSGLYWVFRLKIISPFDIPLFNTAILLISGITATLRHHQIVNNRPAKISLAATVLLGGYFSIIQGFEYLTRRFTSADSSFGSIFFVATGFHGLHVLIGTIFIFSCFLRSLNNLISPFHSLGLELALWYWHFVDVVWLFLFTFVYWWVFY